MILTGYFAKVKAYEKAGYEVISISRWSPKWFTGRKCTNLAPSVSLLDRYKKGEIDELGYTEEFCDYLDGLDVRSVIDELLETTEAKGIVLCCYEKPEDFCHRHLVAENYKSRYGIPIEEFQ